MKRTILTVCALAMILTGCVPVYAASADRTGYPIEVEELLEGGAGERRIRKTYQLSLSDDPAEIPTDDFTRDGVTYHLLDMTRRDDVGVDTKPWIETVSKPSDTDDMEAILRTLDAEIDITTEDGYAGTLRLDHTTVQVAADGYATKTRTLSATRSYPNLSDADVSLVPKTIQENGRTLTLDDVQWEESSQTGAEGTVLRYHATASYTGTASSRYATGYTVTADYSGEVARTGCDMATYTAIFGAVDAPRETERASAAPEDEPVAARQKWDVRFPLIVAGAALGACGGVFAYKKFKRS